MARYLLDARAILLSGTIAVTIATLVATQANGLTLVDETLIIDAPFVLPVVSGPPTTLEPILATNSTILVEGAGQIQSVTGLRSDVELHGTSLFDIDTPGNHLGVIDVFDDSRLVLGPTGSLTSVPGSLISFHNDSILDVFGGGTGEHGVLLGGTSTGHLSGGLIGSGGDGSLQTIENASFLMTGGLLVLPFQAVFGGTSVEISAGNVSSWLVFDAGQAVVSGGTFPGCAFNCGAQGGRWTINGAQVFVHGSNLALELGRLTGILDDGNPIDVLVEGNLANLTLVPEPSTGLLLALGLFAQARYCRKGSTS